MVPKKRRMRFEEGRNKSVGGVGKEKGGREKRKQEAEKEEWCD